MILKFTPESLDSFMDIHDITRGAMVKGFTQRDIEIKLKFAKVGMLESQQILWDGMCHVYNNYCAQLKHQILLLSGKHEKKLKNRNIIWGTDKYELSSDGEVFRIRFPQLHDFLFVDREGNYDGDFHFLGMKLNMSADKLLFMGQYVRKQSESEHVYSLQFLRLSNRAYYHQPILQIIDLNDNKFFKNDWVDFKYKSVTYTPRFSGGDMPIQ